MARTPQAHATLPLVVKAAMLTGLILSVLLAAAVASGSEQSPEAQEVEEFAEFISCSDCSLATLPGFKQFYDGDLRLRKWHRVMTYWERGVSPHVRFLTVEGTTIGLEYLSEKSYEDIVTLLRGRGYLPKAEVQGLAAADDDEYVMPWPEGEGWEEPLPDDHWRRIEANQDDAAGRHAADADANTEGDDSGKVGEEEEEYADDEDGPDKEPLYNDVDYERYDPAEPFSEGADWISDASFVDEDGAEISGGHAEL